MTAIDIRGRFHRDPLIKRKRMNISISEPAWAWAKARRLNVSDFLEQALMIYAHSLKKEKAERDATLKGREND